MARACAGNAALSLLATRGRSGELTRAVRGWARELVGERAAWAMPQGLVLLAGLEHLEGRRAATLQLLQRAAEGYEAVGMSLHAACVRLRLGELDPTSRAADAAPLLLAHGVREPARFCDVVAPPFRP
jgi:hypothetical protein